MDVSKSAVRGASIRPQGRGGLQRIVAAKFEVKDGAVKDRLDAQKLGKMDGHH